MKIEKLNVMSGVKHERDISKEDLEKFLENGWALVEEPVKEVKKVSKKKVSKK